MLVLQTGEMKSQLTSLTSWSMAVALLLFFESAGWAYRPFISTDAAVADVKEMKIELGYLNWEREKGNTTFFSPKVVINYGFINNFELVGEFAVEEPGHGSVRLVDAALSVKAVLKEGVLQEKDGVSFAIEAGPLLPSTGKAEKGVGFEGIAILSGKLEPFIYHVNFGGGVDRAHANPFVIWGFIAELPITPKLRLVGEINGESLRRTSPDNSALLGVIWQAPWQNVSFDAGLRRGISYSAADWMFTTGLTFSFSASASTRN